MLWSSSTRSCWSSMHIQQQLCHCLSRMGHSCWHHRPLLQTLVSSHTAGHQLEVISFPHSVSLILFTVSLLMGFFFFCCSQSVDGIFVYCHLLIVYFCSLSVSLHFIYYQSFDLFLADFQFFVLLLLFFFDDQSICLLFDGCQSFGICYY